MILRRGLPGLLGLLYILSLAGCNSGPRADLVICNGAEPQTLDPALVSGQLEGRICAALYEGLTRRDARGKSIPGAAESWTVSPDGKTYTFTLRPDLRWSNGERVTAEDFRYSWLRALDPATGSPYAEILYFIRGAEDFQAGRVPAESVEIAAPDDRTLVVRLKNPVPFFPSLLSFTTYLPVHRTTVEKYGDRWTRPEYWVGSGPYRLKAWRVNDRVALEKNPKYHSADRVRLNRIDALAVTRASKWGGFGPIIDKGETEQECWARMAQILKSTDFDSVVKTFASARHLGTEAPKEETKPRTPKTIGDIRRSTEPTPARPAEQKALV